MNTLDPKQVIKDIRDHLAAHDRHLAFLFGAGTSSAINIATDVAAGEKPKHIALIPGIEGLTKNCCDAVCGLGTSETEAWKVLVKQCGQDNRPSNVENILSKVRMKIDALGEGEQLLGLDLEHIKKIEKTICATIAKTVTPDECTIPERTPHTDFADWVKKCNRTVPIEIFTTNYDILFERAFEYSNIPVFDGFVGTFRPFFYPECIDDDHLPNSKWMRLWKLHGSVNWDIDDQVSRKRFIRRKPNESGVMILPSHRKYDESRKQPYIAYMDRFTKVLKSEHALLITCGYSFSDAHINAILFEVLENRNTTNIIALMYEDLKESDDLIKVAKQQPRLTVICPNGCAISGYWYTWQLTQPIDNKTCSFIDTAFDSNAAPDDESSSTTVKTDLKGIMRLGDFNKFCLFLNEMGPNIQ